MLEARVSVPAFLQLCFWESSVYVTPVKAKRDSEEKGRRKAWELKLDDSEAVKSHQVPIPRRFG